MMHVSILPIPIDSGGATIREWEEPRDDRLTCASDPFDDFDEDDFDDDFDDDFEEEWDDELPGDGDYQTEFHRDDGGGDLDFDD